jgi:hypothetical protein
MKKRKKEQAVVVDAASPPPQQKTRTWLYVLTAVLVVVLALNAVFYVTYPINLGQYDNVTFLQMMAEGKSNLFHASGYSTLIRFMIMSWYPIDEVDMNPKGTGSAKWFKALHALQLVLHALFFGLALFLVAQLFSRAAAVLMAFGWGINLLFMSSVGSTTPEWFQGDLLLLLLLLCMYARRKARLGKILLYSGVAVLFPIAYLVKYNSLLFAAPLLVLLAFDKEAWWLKGALAVAGALLFHFMVEGYAQHYHVLSTGSTQLNFDHAWVLTASMPEDYLKVPPETLGDNSLRWHALVSITPTEYYRAGPVWTIDYGPKDEAIKKKGEELYASVMSASRAQLIQYVNAHPLPKDYFHFSAATPLYFYYGLDNIDRLGIEVYKESLRLRWKDYARRILQNAWWIVREPDNHPVPTFAYPLDLNISPTDYRTITSGQVLYSVPSDKAAMGLPYYNPVEVLTSYRGVRFFQWFDKMTSASWLYALLNIGALVGFLRLRSFADRLNVLCMLGVLGMFFCASAMLMGMRTKEQITIVPLYFCLLAIGLVSAYGWVSEVVKKRRIARPAEST